MRRPHHDPVIERLGRLPLFATCTRRELDAVARNLTPHHFDAGEVLVSEGRVGREVFVLVEGSARVMIAGRCVAHLRAGEVCGEVAVLDRGGRTATVIADTDLEVLVCSTSEFDTLLVEAPSVTRRLLADLVARLRASDVDLATGR